MQPGYYSRENAAAWIQPAIFLPWIAPRAMSQLAAANKPQTPITPSTQSISHARLTQQTRQSEGSVTPNRMLTPIHSSNRANSESVSKIPMPPSSNPFLPNQSTPASCITSKKRQRNPDSSDLDYEDLDRGDFPSVPMVKKSKGVKEMREQAKMIDKKSAVRFKQEPADVIILDDSDEDSGPPDIEIIAYNPKHIKTLVTWTIRPLIWSTFITTDCYYQITVVGDVTPTEFLSITQFTMPDTIISKRPHCHNSGVCLGQPLQPHGSQRRHRGLHSLNKKKSYHSINYAGKQKKHVVKLYTMPWYHILPFGEVLPI